MITIEQAKKELNGYRYDKKCLEEGLEEIERLKARLEGGSVLLSHLPKGTADENPFETAMADYVELKEKYANMWITAQKNKMQIERKIRQMSQPNSAILYCRYILCYSWIKTADHISLSTDTAKHRLKKALAEYASIDWDDLAIGYSICFNT